MLSVTCDSKSEFRPGWYVLTLLNHLKDLETIKIPFLSEIVNITAIFEQIETITLIHESTIEQNNSVFTLLKFWKTTCFDLSLLSVFSEFKNISRLLNIAPLSHFLVCFFTLGLPGLGCSEVPGLGASGGSLVPQIYVYAIICMLHNPFSF